MTGAMRLGQTMKDMIRRMSRFSMFARATIRPVGVIIAAPTPCRTRIAINISRFTLSAQNNEARVKRPIAPRNTARVPRRATTQPPRGMRTAKVTR